MIILHAGRDEKQFFVWGEGPAEEENLAVKRGRPPKNPVEKPYPFDAGVEGLSSALEMLSVDPSRRETGKITVWMRKVNPVPLDCFCIPSGSRRAYGLSLHLYGKKGPCPRHNSWE